MSNSEIPPDDESGQSATNFPFYDPTPNFGDLYQSPDIESGVNSTQFAPVVQTDHMQSSSFQGTPEARPQQDSHVLHRNSSRRGVSAEPSRKALIERRRRSSERNAFDRLSTEVSDLTGIPIRNRIEAADIAKALIQELRRYRTLYGPLPPEQSPTSSGAIDAPWATGEYINPQASSSYSFDSA